MKKLNQWNNTLSKVLVLILLALAACTPSVQAQPALDPTALFENAMLTATFAVVGPTSTATITPEPSAPEPSPTATPDPYRTPPALPAAFS